MIGIYKLENKINGKIYIGQSTEIEKRIQDHRRTAFNKNCKEYNRPLYRAIRKYGFENFSYTVLEECTVDELDCREIYYIKEYDCLAFGDNQKGYNMAIGGNQGSRYRIKSEEERRKIAENRDYKSRGDHPASKPVVFDNVEYECTYDLCDKFGFNYATIKNMLNHRNNMNVEFYVLGLRYKEEDMALYVKTEKNFFHEKETIVDGIIFKNAKECAEYCGVKAGTIRSWLTGARKMPKEYIERGLRYIY